MVLDALIVQYNVNELGGSTEHPIIDYSVGS